MEKIEISTAKLDWSEIERQVSRDRVSVELSEGEIPLARIVPIDKPRSMGDLARVLREVPRLGEDAYAFAQDVLSVRESIGELDDPWESWKSS